MKLYELAKRIANFVWDIDPYEARDNYENIGELITETLIGLSSSRSKKAIHDYLMDCKTETEYANKLAKEVLAL